MKSKAFEDMTKVYHLLVIELGDGTAIKATIPYQDNWEDLPGVVGAKISEPRDMPPEAYWGKLHKSAQDVREIPEYRDYLKVAVQINESLQALEESQNLPKGDYIDDIIDWLKEVEEDLDPTDVEALVDMYQARPTPNEETTKTDEEYGESGTGQLLFLEQVAADINQAIRLQDEAENLPQGDYHDEILTWLNGYQDPIDPTDVEALVNAFHGRD